MILNKSNKFSYVVCNKNIYRFKYNWIKPQGHDTGIKIYNPFRKTKVPLIFPNKNLVKWYICGPTVYDVSHIGHARKTLGFHVNYRKRIRLIEPNRLGHNADEPFSDEPITGDEKWILYENIKTKEMLLQARDIIGNGSESDCYIRFDMMRRALDKYFDIKPIVALGVTDVAQNIINRANELHMTPAQVALLYTNEFFKQMDALKVLPPHIKLHVSEHIDTIKKFVEVLQKKELAYEKNDDIVFPIKSDKNYGRFQSPEARNTPKDVEFSLWRSNKPGWHVECSAMASYIFGSSIDIHSGGQDLSFPHHENEEALSTCYHNCNQWVNYWIHSGLINIEDEKMSKSLGNLISISDFLHTNSSDDLRMLCLMNPYRTQLRYDTEKLTASVKLCQRIQKFLSLSELYVLGHWPKGCLNEAELLEDLEKTKLKVIVHMKNDFGMDLALKEVILLVKKVLKNFGEEEATNSRSSVVMYSVHTFVKDFFETFGFSFAESKSESSNPVTNIIDAVVNFRMSIRSNVMQKPALKIPLSFCDTFRSDLEKLGIKIIDLPKECYWVRHSAAEINDREFLNKLISTAVNFRGMILNFVNSIKTNGNELLLQECRSLKLQLSTLGIVLLDDTKTYGWTFPDNENTQASKFNLIIKQTVKFLKRVDEIADLMNSKNMDQSKHELKTLHRTALLNLRSFGLKIDQDGDVVCELEEKNPKGESILQNVIDIFIQCFDSVESLKFVCERERVKPLEHINSVSARSLKAKGFLIQKDFISVLTSWTFDRRIDNKDLFSVMLKEISTYIYKLKHVVENENDLQYKNAIMKIHDSVVQDLENTGVVVEKMLRPYSWNFKNFSVYGKYKVGDTYGTEESPSSKGLNGKRKPRKRIAKH